MNCHKCPHARKVQNGAYAKIPFEQTPCAGCTLRDRGSNSFDYDDDRQPFRHEEIFYELHHTPPALPDQPESRDPAIAILSLVLATIMQLTPKTRDALIMRYQGLKYKEIARLQGTSIAAAEQRVKNAIALSPILAPLLPAELPRKRLYHSDKIKPPKPAESEESAP